MDVDKAEIINFYHVFSGSQFYLVLDVTNLTLQEMTLNYTENKTILIEAKESCRIPVPVERCDLERILDEHKEVNEGKNNNNYPLTLNFEYFARTIYLQIKLCKTAYLT